MKGHKVDREAALKYAAFTSSFLMSLHGHLHHGFCGVVFVAFGFLAFLRLMQEYELLSSIDSLNKFSVATKKELDLCISFW